MRVQVFIAVYLLIFCGFVVKSQENVNMSFEDWKTVTPPLGSSYDDIDGWWATVNDIKRLTGNADHLTAFKYTPAQHENYAIRLKSVMALTTFVPGVVVTGTFSFNQQQLKQGKPFTSKPTQLKGYFKYFPVNNDSGVAYIHLSRFNTATNQRDTLARDSVLFIGTTSEYQEFTLNLDYSQFPGVSPDSIVIRFVSSVNAGFGGGKAGSELIIDNLQLTYPVSNEPAFAKPEVRVFPNPSTDEFHIECTDCQGMTIEIYSSIGQTIGQILQTQAWNNPTNITRIAWNTSQKGLFLLLIKDKLQNVLYHSSILRQ